MVNKSNLTVILAVFRYCCLNFLDFLYFFAENSCVSCYNVVK